MSRNLPHNRDRARDRRESRDSPEAGPSATDQLLTRNDVLLKTEETAIPVIGSAGSFNNTSNDALTDPPIEIDCDCIVEQLKKTLFIKRDRSEQLEIISRGRPMPSLKLLSVDDSGEVKQVYQFCDWICACDKFKRLFCWPCLLFNKTINGWDLMSIHNIKDLIILEDVHESSPCHISALVDFTIFQNDSASSDQKHLHTYEYNRLITKNRLIISRFIHIICYLTQQKLPLYTEGISVGPENFSELLYLLKRFDPVLNMLLEGSEPFSNLSPNFLNDLLESICNSVLKFIKNDLAYANYITIILEEIKSTPDLIKLASVLRYTDIHGVVHERFIGFSEFPKDRMIFHYVNDSLQQYTSGKKLAAVSFLGPTFLSLKNQFLLDQIKLVHKEVTFIHSYSHNELHTISTFINYNSESKLYFSNLMDVSNVFSKSLSLRLILQEKINEEVSWTYDSNLVHTISKYRYEILSLLEHIEEIEVWDQEIIFKARAIRNYMKNFDFTVLSFFFVEVFSINVPIFALCINNVCDIDQYLNNIDRFVEGIDNLTSRYPVIWENIMIDLGLEGLKSPFASLKKRFEKLFNSIKDTIIFKVRDLKFTDVKLLRFIRLLEPKHFPDFSQDFPMELFNEIKDTKFMYMFDMRKLESELEVVYQNSSLRKGDIYEFYIYLRSSGLCTTLVETSKLAEFIVTLPLGPALPDKFYSASSRIKQYLQDLLPKGVSSSGAILFIERSFLTKLKKDTAFENHIIEDFSRKVPVLELVSTPNL